jgi:hypothetical protein
VITIYIVGDRIPEIDTACVRVNREYYDAVHEKTIGKRSNFIELLTHDSVVVQTGRIESGRYRTELDKLLSVFEQDHFVGDSGIYKDYKHRVDSENIRRITDILHCCASSAEERQQIEAEHEAWRVYYALVKEEREKVNEQIMSLAEKDAIIAEKDAALIKKDAALVEKNAALAREQEEKKRILAEKEALITELNALKNRTK